MKHFELYGYPTGSLDAIKNLLESALDIKFQERESYYRCGKYFRYDYPTQGRLLLQRNHDEIEDEWTEEAHHNIDLLLYAEDIPPQLELEGILSQYIPEMTKLRSETV